MLYKYRYIAIPVLLALLAGCGRPRGSRELVVVHRGMPLTMLPHKFSEVITNSVQANILEGLVGFDRELRVIPLLAERWENPDDLTWRFILRPGVSFHDGRPLRPEDVRYSLNLARDDTGSALRSVLVTVESVTIEGRYIQIRTAKPDPVLLNKLVLAFIVPEGSLDPGKREAYAQAPAGTGPYRLVRFSAGERIELAFWDGYWGPAPDFRSMVIRRQPDVDQALRQLEALEADIVTEIPATKASELEATANRHFRIVPRGGLTLRYLGVKFNSRPFSDLRMRRAVSLAVDRRTLVENVLHGYGSVVNQLSPEEVFGYNPTLPELEFNPALARRLMAQTGYPRGLALGLVISEKRKELGLELKRQLAQVGIELEVRAMAREPFFKALDTAQFFAVGYISSSGDISELYNDIIHSKGRGFGTTNYTRYRSPAIDRLIEGSNGMINQGQRIAVLQRIMALTMDELPLIPLYNEDEIYAVSTTVEWKPRMDAMVLGKEVRLAKKTGGLR